MTNKTAAYSVDGVGTRTERSIEWAADMASEWLQVGASVGKVV